jgi:hypothetical protein
MSYGMPSYSLAKVAYVSEEHVQGRRESRALITSHFKDYNRLFWCLPIMAIGVLNRLI